MAGRAQLPRFWRIRAESSGRSRRTDPALHFAEGPLPPTAAAVASHACTVLLGPPGAGKSTALQSVAKASASCFQIVSLARAQTDVRLLEKVGLALGQLSVGTGTHAILVLDSLDETSLSSSELSGFIFDAIEQLPQQLSLVLACRSAGWLPGVEADLRNHFGKGLAVYDLAPLRSEDIATYASSASVDGQRFLEAVKVARVMPLARNASTLKLLLDEYVAAEGSLPTSQADLFGRSCRRLLREPDPHRERARNAFKLSLREDCAGGWPA